MISRLDGVPAHQALFLMKNCLCIPKLAYMLRCAPTYLTQESLISMDKTIHGGIEQITNTALTGDAWEQASLPVRNGVLVLGRRKT